MPRSGIFQYDNCSADERNIQAAGESSGYGSNLEVHLISEEDASYQLSFFQDILPWHLKVSGASADPVKIFKVKEFIDLDEISHPVFRNAGLSEIRARAEIDSHTHAKFFHSVELGTIHAALKREATLKEIEGCVVETFKLEKSAHP